jgi:SAM-dependent methyltransferase
LHGIGRSAGAAFGLLSLHTPADTSKDMDQWLLDHLACPRCRAGIVVDADGVTCARGHRYPVIDGIPIMLLDDVRQTHWGATSSIEQSQGAAPLEPITDADVYDFVRAAVGATGGNLYVHLRGRLPRLPIPAIPFDVAPGARFLDIGCHWGRWCMAAARRGCRVVGIDPYLPAVRVAKAVARSLNLPAAFVVGDGRYLPFAASAFDVVHSFSVLQHFSEADVAQCATEIGRVLVDGGGARVQMAQRFGLLNIVQQARRRFRTPSQFEVRYWRGADLVDVFRHGVGSASLAPDSFLSLNAQATDLDLLQPHHRWIVGLSARLRNAAAAWPPLTQLADSVYVVADKPATAHMAAG